MNNEKFLNYTTLSYYHGRLETLFATNDDLSTLSAKVDQIIAEGGEPNVIETVKVNNTALPVSNKAVNIDLSGYAETSDVPTKTSELTNDGDGTSNFATESYVDSNGGKIQKVKVNGTALPIDTSDKSVDVTVPTKVSDLTNDENFQTDTEVEAAIDAKITSTYKAGGTVAFANLPALTSANEGKVYDVSDNFTTTADFVEGAGKNYPAGTNVAIIEVSANTYKYDVMAGFIDQSALWAKNELTAITTAEIDALFT